MTDRIKPGPIDTLILFGGGLLLIKIASLALSEGIKTVVFAVKRHLDEIIDPNEGLSLEELMIKKRIPFYHEADINLSSKLPELMSQATMGIGLGEGYCFIPKTIDLFGGRLFDFMVIRLPECRGGAHFTWQILRGDRVGCWNIQKVNEKMIPGVFDSGEIIKTRKYTIPEGARIPRDYFQVADEEGINLFSEFLGEVQLGKGFHLAEISETASSCFPRLFTPKHGWIDWSWTTSEIERFICAFDDPYIGASTTMNGRRVYLKGCYARVQDGPFHPFMAGLIYRITRDAFFVCSKTGGLEIRSILGEDGEFLGGFLKPGQRLFSPKECLEDSMRYSAEYDSEGLVEAELEKNYGLYD